MARRKFTVPDVYGIESTGYGEENEDKRNSLKGERIPSINDLKNGYGYNDFSPDKEDTVIFGHPEVAGIHTFDHNENETHLGGEYRRTDLNFVSAEDVRKRSKGTTW